MQKINVIVAFVFLITVFGNPILAENCNFVLYKQRILNLMAQIEQSGTINERNIHALAELLFVINQLNSGNSQHPIKASLSLNTLNDTKDTQELIRYLHQITDTLAKN